MSDATPLLRATPQGFLRAGRPHQIVSGAVHYFRVHPDLWRDRLRRVVALGCDTVETYVAWNVHQPSPGVSTFAGGADLGRFLDIAAEEGLDAIVRPGPYICAEWDNGGFPGWLLRDRSLRLRCLDEPYLAAVDAWFDELIPVIAERQACRGGNVVMVQVENEFGSYGDDTAYLEHVRDGLRARGIEEMLVTSDGPGRQWLTGGRVDGALATVNFGSRTDEVLAMARDELPGQPLMCMEFWNGWFDHWGEEHHARSAESAAAELEAMLAAGMSVNFYMAHGGTNVGLLAGANADEGLQPTTTSYDYDAPIAEDGALTPKFHAFREVIARHRDLPPLEEELDRLGLDARPPLLAPAPVRIEGAAALRTSRLWTDPAERWARPPAFEDLGLERGMALYRRDVELLRIADEHRDAPAVAPRLRLYGLHDRAWVFLDGRPVGTAEGTGSDSRPAVVDLGPVAEDLLGQAPHRPARLEILVEGLGRVNFGPQLGERKGILGGVWLGMRFVNGWEVRSLPLEDMGGVFAAHVDGSVVGADAAEDLPLLVGASFAADAPRGTYLDVSRCGHGVAYVNGTCVGRYWSIGPQQALYVPPPLVRAGRNEVLLLELERPDPALALADGPIWSTPAT